MTFIFLLTLSSLKCARINWLVPAYRKLCDEPIASCEVSNLSCLLNPWSQLMGRNGGALAVDVVIDGIVDVDVLALREDGDQCVG